MRRKRITASILCAAMLMSLSACQKKQNNVDAKEEATVTTEETASSGDSGVEEKAAEAKVEEAEVYDGQEVLNLTFDDNGTEKFDSYVNGGGLSLSNSDKQLVCSISNCGSLDYANQAFRDGFKLIQGTVYTYSFDISCDIARQVQFRIQLNSGDYHAYTEDNIVVGPEVYHFTSEFTMTETSDPAPRLVFNMGKMEDMTEDPGPHEVYIDNVRLVVKDASNKVDLEGLPEYAKVNINQIGYKPKDKKIAYIKDEKNDVTCKIIDLSDDKVVLSKNVSESHYSTVCGEYIRQLDFSELDTPGSYKIIVSIGEKQEESYEFKIGDDIYNDIYRDIVKLLYKQRCGIKTDPSITGEGFSHDVCHDQPAIVYGEERAVDVSGGWHDAGDYGRYVVPGAKTVQDLLLSYELFDVEDDDIGIPESGNEVPDLLDEARFELEWMLKMQDEYSGGVFHKVSCKAFPETVAPEAETDELVLSPISGAATLDFAAVMAKASTIYDDYDPEFAEKCFAAAVRAWDYIEKSNNIMGFRNPGNIVTGEYKDDNTADEIFFAAAELYIAGDEELKDKLEPLYTKFVRNGLGWADMGTYAMYDLSKSDVDGIDDLKNKTKEDLLTYADEILENSKKDDYHNAITANYPWGSNMLTACNGVVLFMAEDLTKNEEYLEYSRYQLDYILGANNLGYCFVTSYGTKYPENPHHRPSQVAKKAMSGMMVGGPDNSLEDPYAAAVLKDQPKAMCYVDSEQSYSTNEIAIYWNSSLILLMSAFR